MVLYNKIYRLSDFKIKKGNGRYKMKKPKREGKYMKK